MAVLHNLAQIAIATSSILSWQLNVLSPGKAIEVAPRPVPVAEIASQAKSGINLPNSGDRSQPARSRGSGSRGCEDSTLSEGHLITLAIPSDEFVGQIASGRPTFFWRLSKSLDVPIEFSLARQGTPEPLHQVRIESPKAGSIAVKLPEDRPELSPGGMYLWSVTLVCNEKRPSANPIFFSWVERVPETRELQQDLAIAKTARDRAAVYARAGLWYDALAILAEVPESSPDYAAAQADFQELLAAAGLDQRAWQ